jgi:Rieske Fe-S protein
METPRSSITINRREFLLLATGLAVGCQSGQGHSHAERAVSVGPVSFYARDGVYTRFRDQGIFIVRRGEKLFALSSICTHRKCKLNAESDRSFYCQCHGSTFDPDGHVTEGPARRNLPLLPIYTDDKGRLQVRVSA